MSKDLVAVYIDANDSFQEKVIGSGTTADFAKAVGFYVTQEIHDEVMPSALYPVLYWDDIRNLEGRLLTICDAVFNDSKQLESVKSLVRNNLHDWYDSQFKQLDSQANNK